MTRLGFFRIRHEYMARHRCLGTYQDVPDIPSRVAVSVDGVHAIKVSFVIRQSMGWKEVAHESSIWL